MVCLSILIFMVKRTLREERRAMTRSGDFSLSRSREIKTEPRLQEETGVTAESSRAASR